MIFKHKKLSESVVMKEFEKVAIAKKMVKASEEPTLTKEASASYEPSNDLIDDMLKLANGLRTRGFEKDASSLEEKVLTYKLAETHLYRAIDEDAEDMLEFAHPKKNKITFDAANGDGEVEDTLSQHKKILDIVNKQPKKVAFDVLAETADILGLKKKAEVASTSELVSNINFLKNQLWKIIPKNGAIYVSTASSSKVLAIGVGATLWTLVEGIPGNYFTPHEKDDFEIKFLEFYRRANGINAMQWQYSFNNSDADFREFTDNAFVSHANANLENLYDQFKEKLNKLPDIDENVDATTINKFIEGLYSLIDKNSWFVIKGLTNNNGELENKIRITFIKQMSLNAQELAKTITVKQPAATGMDKVLDSGFANIIAGRFESVIGKDNHSDYFKNIASLIKANGGKPYKELYTQLVQFDKDLASATDESKLDLIGQNWQKGYKVALKSNNLIKEALTPGEVFKAPSITPATVPATYNQPAGRNAGRSAVKEKSTFEQAFPEEFNAVSTMQNSLQLLADNLDKFGVSKDKQTQIRNILLGTGGIQGTFNGRVDGIWGGKTETALQKANVILASHGIKEKLSTDAQRINGELQEGHTPADVAKFALKNVEVFNKALDSVGISVDNKNKQKSGSAYLDNIPENSNLLQTDPPADEDENGVGLTTRDLSSFSGLSNFIRRNFQNLDFSAGGLNYQKWVAVLNWFYKRAYQQAKQLRNEDGQDQIKANKAKYIALVTNLYDDLNKFYDALANKNPAQIITPKELDGNTSLPATNGPTQQAAYKSDPNAEGAETQANVNKVEPPPFGYEINIDNLYKKYGHFMDHFDNYRPKLSIQLLNLNTFSYSPNQIISQYIKGLDNNEILEVNNISPNALIPNQTNTKYTFSDLMNANVPFSMILKKRAYDYALLAVVEGLLRDLPAVVSAYIQNSPSDQYNKIITNAWDKWAANLNSTRSRINSDFSQAGQIPKASF